MSMCGVYECVFIYQKIGNVSGFCKFRNLVLLLTKKYYGEVQFKLFINTNKNNII